MSILGMLFRPLFATVLIGVHYDMNSCVVKVVKKRGGSIVEETEKEFKILDGVPSVDVIKYIKRIKTRYAFSYLAVLSRDSQQVLVPGTKKNQFNDFNVNEKDYKFVKLPSAFAFMLKNDIGKYQDMFKKAKGLDYLFSPFVLLFFKSKTFMTDRPKLFVLQEKEYLTIMVATKKAVLYGTFLHIAAHEQESESISADIPEEEDSLIAETMQKSSTAQGLEDLDVELSGLDDELEDYENYSFENIGGDSSEVGSLGGESHDHNELDGIHDLGYSTTVFNLLQTAMRDFYQNSLYASDFIEEIVLFDCCEVSSQAIDNIRSNLMLDLSLVSLDLMKELTNTIQIEIDS